MHVLAAAVAVPLLTGSVLFASPPDALLPEQDKSPSERGGTLLAQDSEGGVAPFPIAPRLDRGSPADSSAVGPREEAEGVSPFPIAPRPGGEPPAASAAAGPGGETDEGVSPFALPSTAQGSGDHSAGTSPEQRWVEPSPRPRVATDEGAAPGARSEQEVGVPSFPYDPEARADSRRACARACADYRDGCARAGQPVEQCEGNFVLCFRDCATGSGPDDIRPPAN